MVSQEDNQLSVASLIELCKVSKSGYYNWVNVTRVNQQLREIKDKADFDEILKVHTSNKYSKGYRMIHMCLLHNGILMNTKKVRRLMKKFGLKSHLRKPRPHDESNART